MKLETVFSMEKQKEEKYMMINNFFVRVMKYVALRPENDHVIE